MRDGFAGNGEGLELGNFNSNFVWAFDQVLPTESFGPLGTELIEQRDGIVIIQKNEMSADREVEPGLND
jgi:hypothetical protein